MQLRGLDQAKHAAQSAEEKRSKAKEWSSRRTQAEAEYLERAKANRERALQGRLNAKVEAERVLSQLKLIIRPMYSSPPIHGALIVSEVLGDEPLKARYYAECLGMAERIGAMRTTLRQALEASGSTHDWTHVTDQIGMFAFTGMDAAMCDRLTDEHNIFLTRDGRISVAGVNSGNVDYIAAAVHDVTKGKSIGA